MITYFYFKIKSLTKNFFEFNDRLSLRIGFSKKKCRIVGFYAADRGRNRGRSGRGLDGPEASGPNPNRTIRSGTEPESGPQGLGPKPPEDQSAAGRPRVRPRFGSVLHTSNKQL